MADTDVAQPPQQPVEKKKREKRHLHQDAPPPSSAWGTVGRVAGLLGLIPAVLSIPYFLSLTGSLMKDNMIYIYVIWVFYAVVQAYIFFRQKKETITLNSWSTQNLTWAVFTLGIYTMIDVPRFLPHELRQVALYVWCSATMVLNLIFFFVDDTNYKEEERKEKRREEKRQKIEDQRKKEEKDELLKDSFISKMDPTTRKMVDSALYVLYAAILLGVSYKGYYWLLDYQEQLNLKHGIQPEVVEDIELDYGQSS
eukprot:TRINITY_DN1621_c0_g1_i1.p1 TRINITY_DN1621_c0_g1~~TRINITY_DN1621_c0_g1_i1.p1  ORF type:complete len:265 (+),score=67.60 TRINITY_DN1621_c0_g1_i1:36-797(+)